MTKGLQVLDPVAQPNQLPVNGVPVGQSAEGVFDGIRDHVY
jgi:hypothetical protein